MKRKLTAKIYDEDNRVLTQVRGNPSEIDKKLKSLWKKYS